MMYKAMSSNEYSGNKWEPIVFNAKLYTPKNWKKFFIPSLIIVNYSEIVPQKSIRYSFNRNMGGLSSYQAIILKLKY